MSDSVRPHRRQPTRLSRPWDSPGKNTGVGCHFLLQCMKVKSESEAAQSCPTLCDPMDCSLPGSSIHGIFQATVLEWPLPSPNSCSNLYPLSWWCYLTISSFCFQFFPASRSFLMSWCFISGGQSTRASASVLPVNFQGWFRLDWFNLLAVQGILKSLQSVSYLGFCCCCCCCSFVLFYFTNKWKHTVFVFLFLI